MEKSLEGWRYALERRGGGKAEDVNIFIVSEKDGQVQTLVCQRVISAAECKEAAAAAAAQRHQFLEM